MLAGYSAGGIDDAGRARRRARFNAQAFVLFNGQLNDTLPVKFTALSIVRAGDITIFFSRTFMPLPTPILMATDIEFAARDGNLIDCAGMAARASAAAERVPLLFDMPRRYRMIFSAAAPAHSHAARRGTELGAYHVDLVASARRMPLFARQILTCLLISSAISAPRIRRPHDTAAAERLAHVRRRCTDNKSKWPTARAASK